MSADPAIIQEIAANPEGFYVDLHNARFPGARSDGYALRWRMAWAASRPASIP